MFIGTITGIVSATTRPPSSRARCDTARWRSMRAGSRASTTSRFQFSGRFARTDICGQQLELVVAEAVARAVEDALERGARPAAGLLAQREDLVRVRHRAQGPGRRCRRCANVKRRSTSRARPARAPSPSTARSCASSSGVALRPFASAPSTKRRSALCPSMKPAFTPRLPSSASRYSPKLCHVHGHALFERGERHALDLREHAARVVGVGVVQWCEAEAAVAADHRRDAVNVRRRRERIPEELRVVVRVRVDEAGAHDETGRVEVWCAASASVPAGHDRDDASAAHSDVTCGRRATTCRPRWLRPGSDGRAW